MNKQEFLWALEEGLKGLPKEDIRERLNFYSEIIEDSIDEGFSEEEAIENIGSIDEIVSAIIDEAPLSGIIKERLTPKRKSPLKTTLLILGSPIWLSLIICVAAAMFSLFVSLWAVVISLWAVFASLAVCVPVSIIGGIALILSGNTLAGLFYIGAGLVLGGISILLFIGIKYITRGLTRLLRLCIAKMKSCFIKKEGV